MGKADFGLAVRLGDIEDDIGAHPFGLVGDKIQLALDDVPDDPAAGHQFDSALLAVVDVLEAVGPFLAHHIGGPLDGAAPPGSRIDDGGEGNLRALVDADDGREIMAIDGIKHLMLLGMGHADMAAAWSEGSSPDPERNESYKYGAIAGARMDALITAAARALAAGDTLGALKRVALRDDAPALALRGIVMARLGDLARAKALLEAAARGFGQREAVARARCLVAQAEIALVSRDLSWPVRQLDSARATLEAHGDHLNAAHARNVQARRLLLMGHLDDAEHRLEGLDPTLLPPASRAACYLTLAGIAIRRLRTAPAGLAFAEAERAAYEAGIPALMAEVAAASAILDRPAARLIAGGEDRLMVPAQVEAVLTSEALVVDACRNVVRQGRKVVSLATRPVLLALARTMAEAYPNDAPRNVLLAEAFGARQVDESHRARLRVEMGRLRAALAGMADITATKRGFSLLPRYGREIAVLAPPVEEPHGAVLAFLADGESWSSSALAIALGTSPRTVQRALEALAAQGKVEAFGNGRARRWTTPSVPGFPTTLLLPGPLPGL